MKITPLDPDKLYKPCDLSQLDFVSSHELDDIDLTVGQDRATESLKLGIRIAKHGFNVFAMAPAGTGKLTSVMQLAEHEANRRSTPPDWCYVNNFSQPTKPNAIGLPAGQGRVFQADMDDLIDELSIAIPTAFDGDEYRSRVGELESKSRQREIDQLSQLRDEASAAHIMLTETSTGYAFTAADEKDQPMSSEAFNALDKTMQHEIQDAIIAFQERLQSLIKKFPVWRKETKRQLQALNREIAELAVNHSIDDLLEKYAEHATIMAYLKDVKQDVIQHVRDFIPHAEKPFSFMEMPQEQDPFKRYQVNLMVDLGGKKSAPVIFEPHPNYGNLLGRIDHQAFMGSLVTDFTMIKPGALHKANGGFLILDAHKLLIQPYAWESLKRTLQTKEIQIESLERALSLISTSALEPEPIPLDIKVILIGEPIVYYLLSAYDPEFHDLFKVAADFDYTVAREPKTHDYARLLATLARREQLRPLSRQAVARVVEHSARLAGDSEKLLTHLRSITDLLTESDYWAQTNGHSEITQSDIQQAIDHKTRRLDKIREKLYENVVRGTLIIKTENRVPGQINGLSVLQLGEFAFGLPVRITATTRLGNGKIVDILRETELGGALHSKGVMILSNYIAAKYARTCPFSLSASVVFEQTYGQVEGDSASLAELCAILSSLAGIPLRQDLAVTGSVDQLGNVQPIGGVNEKIEGFFDICSAKGLNGSQGVIIPAGNIKHLMLRWDVVHAAQKNQFLIYAVESIDAALEILTGLEAGNLDKDGNYPDQTVNAKVDAQIKLFADKQRTFDNKTNKVEQ